MTSTYNLTSDRAVYLAAIWFILLGAALRPAPLVLARLVARFAIREVLAVLLKWGAAAVLAGALAVASAMPAPAAAETCMPVVTPAAVSTSPSLDHSVTEAFLRVTGPSVAPLPIWLLESAARIYTAYKTYRNGQRVEEAARIAHAALAEMARVRAEIEAGRALTEQEQHLVRMRLEAQTSLIEGLDYRVSDLEGRTHRIEQETGQLAGIVRRRGCPPFHAWDRYHRRCANRQ